MGCQKTPETPTPPRLQRKEQPRSIKRKRAMKKREEAETLWMLQSVNGRPALPATPAWE